MYVNKCIKCGREFETKNPKRVICPDCLYPDKKMIVSSVTAEEEPVIENTEEVKPDLSAEEQPKFYTSYSAGEGRETAPRPHDNRTNNYNRNNQNRMRDNRSRSGYNNQRQQGNRRNNQRPQQGGFNNNRGYRNNFNNQRSNSNRRPMNKSRGPKQLLISKEQLEQIELLYKPMLPLPNPDVHEVIGEKIGLEPRKVFFGINLVRQKLLLPKIPFPKRRLAISPDQLFAIKSLYEPLLPLPPIGCHKIIAAQLKMDEWRVHVGIGLVRTQMGLDRWNQEREDCPEEYKKTEAEETDAEKPKRGRKPKKE